MSSEVFILIILGMFIGGSIATIIVCAVVINAFVRNANDGKEGGDDGRDG